MGWIKAIGVALVGFVLFILGRKSSGAGNNRGADERTAIEGVGRLREEIKREGRDIESAKSELERASGAVANSIDINRDSQQLLDRAKDLERLDELAFRRLREAIKNDPLDGGD